MKGKLRLVIIILAVLLGVALIGVIIVNNIGNEEEKEFDTSTVVSDETVNIQEITTTEEEIATINDPDPILPLDEIYYRNNSGAVIDNEQDIINEIEKRSSAYLTDIFNYSGYTEEYGEKVFAGKANIEEYPNVKDYYPDTIIDAFDELKVNSSVKGVKVLGITMADVKDGKYSALVRGYVETDFSMTDIDKDTYYILFKDNIILDGDKTYHFDTYFSYIFKTEGFSYGLMDDNSNEIRYEGEDIYQFDLESYNPAYDLNYEEME